MSPFRKLSPMRRRAATPAAPGRRVLPSSGATCDAEGIRALGMMGIDADHPPFHDVITRFKPRNLDHQRVTVVTDYRRPLSEVLSARVDDRKLREDFFN